MLRRVLHLAVATALAVTAALAPDQPSASAAQAPYTATDLHFKVTVGPGGDQTCDIEGTVYVPDDAGPSSRVPAILSTNGFGGSKDDQDPLSAYAASHGYVALTYSGLGFGNSSCDITLDDRDHDGEAAAQLIDYLGGKAGIAFTNADHTETAPPLDAVQLDGDAADQDPRVGMVGGSYGGQVQYAAAAVSDKLDTIVPIITWNDLSYSLGPNNTDQLDSPPQVSTRTPGAPKTNWALAFSAIGLTGDVANQQPDPLTSACPNFREEVCPALAGGVVNGALAPEDVAFLRHASVRDYAEDVTIPTLILQGQADTLFNLNEAAATYTALQEQGTDVKMSWIEYGHSGPPADGELDLGAPDPATQHITKRIFDWFAHYLKDEATAPTGPEFSYFRDWVDYEGIATPAYASSDSYPVGRRSTYHLSSTPSSTGTGGMLVTDRADVTTGSQSFAATAVPVPDEDLDVVGMFLDQPEQPEPATDLPGTAARYDTAPLGRHVDVVGSPEVRLQVEAPTVEQTQGGDVGKLVVYLKIRDIAPDGTSEVVRNLVAPVRFPDVADPVTVTMPAFVHRFEKGHRIRLSVSGSSPNYRGNTAAVPVTVDTTSGPGAAAAGGGLPLQSITLPTLGDIPPSAGTPPRSGPEPGTNDDPSAGPGDRPEHDDARTSAAGNGTPRAATGDYSSSGSSLPDTGGPVLWLLILGGVLLASGAVLLRSRGSARQG
ncbi:hypothetical protein GCM10011519_05510 [Marmoricola endophyticus]|uniref:Xaa-Pro dipeptidyl-peptidase C-terminal domain-containing protein n=1 Tax=Marmoricola endophyticus TaxID=2040280 RepID=A0A917F1Z1_9ACTN|nr:CocE/NonD family hydrolase [Marmoricola endophyticus]GGF34952.1 hypothetical protein GCM10011519_05510 [Marmoricola endophyticus]